MNIKDRQFIADLIREFDKILYGKGINIEERIIALGVSTDLSKWIIYLAEQQMPEFMERIKNENNKRE